MRIEFRQHEGTLKGHTAMVWAMFCVKLVQFSEETDKKRMRELCKDAIYTEILLLARDSQENWIYGGRDYVGAGKEWC